MGKKKTNEPEKVIKKTRIHGRNFTVFPKQNKSGEIFYASFRLANGKFGTAKSTGQKTRGAAENWAQQYWNAGTGTDQGKGAHIVTKENVKFEDFVIGFFDNDSPYAKKKIKKMQRGASERRLAELNAKLNKYLIPKFGKCVLSSIDEDMIDKYQDSLIGKIHGFTINQVFWTLKVILQEAYRQKLIHIMPQIERVGSVKNTRNILTMPETALLFKTPWENLGKAVLNDYALELRCASMVACATGLRQGEILALKRSSVFSTYLNVTHSWDSFGHKLKLPKTKSSIREVPFPSIVYKNIAEVMEQSEWQENDDFIFQGPNKFYTFDDGTKVKIPIHNDYLLDALYSMLERLGINHEERNINFHSFRHQYNTMLISGGVPLLRVQYLTGHKSDAMSLNYLHDSDNSDIVKLQQSLFK